MSRPTPPDAVFPAVGVQVREHAVQDYEAPAGATPLGPLAAARQGDAAATLRTLVSLHDEGLLTDQEYAAKRAEVIARI